MCLIQIDHLFLNKMPGITRSTIYFIARNRKLSDDQVNNARCMTLRRSAVLMGLCINHRIEIWTFLLLKTSLMLADYIWWLRIFWSSIFSLFSPKRSQYDELAVVMKKITGLARVCSWYQSSARHATEVWFFSMNRICRILKVLLASKSVCNVFQSFKPNS